MSASTSCSERARAAIESIRSGRPLSREEVRTLGEECPSDFFRLVIEPLADSFDPEQAAIYAGLMRAWNLGPASASAALVPEDVETVYVLSRVTLGADIKIASMILDAMKRRFPEARIVFVANRKSAELFAADPRIEHLEASYPRTGPVSQRIRFADDLRARLTGTRRIVVDPDSRMTQLGLIPVCEPGRYFHFPSRTAGGSSDVNLTELTRGWLENTFGIAGEAYVEPSPVQIEGERPMAAVSLGVGENESKRIPGAFESDLIHSIAARCRTVWIDRGAGGEEASRVTGAVESSGAGAQIRYWEGSFAGFVSVIAQSDFYAGYDSAGQHAAAAAGVPLVTVFAGAPSRRFRSRWSPRGRGRISIFDPSDSRDLREVLAAIFDSGRL